VKGMGRRSHGAKQSADHALGSPIEHRDRAAWPDDARQLRERRSGVVHVAEQICEGDMVEGRVGERDGLCGGLDQLHVYLEPVARDREHLLALVEPGYAEAAAHELGGHQAGSCCDIEDMPIVGKTRCEEAPPARILAEREHGVDAVVRGAERCEELAGVGGS